MYGNRSVHNFLYGNWQYGIRRVPEYGNRRDTKNHVRGHSHLSRSARMPTAVEGARGRPSTRGLAGGVWPRWPSFADWGWGWGDPPSPPSEGMYNLPKASTDHGQRGSWPRSAPSKNTSYLTVMKLCKLQLIFSYSSSVIWDLVRRQWAWSIGAQLGGLTIKTPPQHCFQDPPPSILFMTPPPWRIP